MISLRTRQRRANDHDDKLVPMINVIFLLLMFFLIVGNLSRVFGEQLLLPRSVSEALSRAAEPELTLAGDGSLLWGSEAVGVAALGARLRAHPGGVPAGLRLRADARATAAGLLPVLDALRAAGVERVSVVTVRRDRPVRR